MQSERQLATVQGARVLASQEAASTQHAGVRGPTELESVRQDGPRTKTAPRDRSRQTDSQRTEGTSMTTDEDGATTAVVNQSSCRASRVNQASSESGYGSQNWEPVNVHQIDIAGVLWGPPDSSDRFSHGNDIGCQNHTVVPIPCLICKDLEVTPPLFYRTAGSGNEFTSLLTIGNAGSSSVSLRRTDVNLMVSRGCGRGTGHLLTGDDH